METDNTNAEVTEQDNALIRDLRSQIDSLGAQLKTAKDDAQAEVRRELQAKASLGSYESLAPYFVQEVDGEPTAEAAQQWLASKGLVEAVEDATPNETPTESPEQNPLAAVANLSSDVASVSAVRSGNDFTSRVQEIEGRYKSKDSLANLAAELAAIQGQ